MQNARDARATHSAAILTVVVGSATAFAPQVANVRSETSLFGRKPFITGNWKLNPTTKDEAVSLATGIADAVTKKSPGDVALFVPYPYLESVQAAVDGKVTIGAEVRFVVLVFVSVVLLRLRLRGETAVRK
jgi:triosephosphate isomerase